MSFGIGVGFGNLECVHTQIRSKQDAGLEFTLGFHIYFDEISRIVSFVAGKTLMITVIKD